MFFGRIDELKILNDAYNNDSFESIAIYGRRRIGNSELIKESYKNLECKRIYYECKKASEEFNIVALCDKLAEEFNIPKPNFKTLDSALRFIFEKSISEKIVLVFDEYPYMRGTSDFLDSIIQGVIDDYKNNSKIKFILCGSYIDVMEQILSSKSPLYGRFTYKLNIKQMNYLESSLFYSNASNEDKVKYYSVFGGVPYYNQFIDDKLTVKENIINLLIGSKARLLSEAESFLNDEITKLNNANECFTAIAEGNVKFNDILQKSNVTSSPTLSDVLKKLINMDVVEKVYPINDENEKKSYYNIIERLSLFYYRYIFKRGSYFNVMSPEDFYNEFISLDFENYYVPKEFENIAKQYLIIQNKNKKINPPLYKVGKYYYDLPKEKKNGEFDVVTLSKNGYDFYEVKFTEKKLDDKVVNEEIYQLSNANIKYNKLGFISKNGFSISNPQEYILITLDDIYK